MIRSRGLCLRTDYVTRRRQSDGSSLQVVIGVTKLIDRFTQIWLPLTIKQYSHDAVQVTQKLWSFKKYQRILGQ